MLDGCQRMLQPLNQPQNQLKPQPLPPQNQLKPLPPLPQNQNQLKPLPPQPQNQNQLKPLLPQPQNQNQLKPLPPQNQNQLNQLLTKHLHHQIHFCISSFFMSIRIREPCPEYSY